jgi:protein SCO1/2
MKLAKRVASAVGATLLLFSLTAKGHEEKAAPASPLTKNAPMPVIRAAPDFSLFDVENRLVKLSQLRGRTVLVAFIYTGCTSACPLLSFRMARLQEKLARAQLDAVLLSVTVDPQRDDAKALAAFGKRFHARPGWHFLREEPERLAPVLADYGEWTRVAGELDHPARLHLIDGAGRVREIYSLAFFDEDQAFLDIHALAREGRAVSRSRSQAR